MRKPETQYIIRGFNLVDETFQAPTGLIEEKKSFKEMVVVKQHEAIVAMMCDDDFITMTVPYINSIKYTLDVLGSDEMEALDPKNMVYVVDLKITIAETDKLEVKRLKSSIREDLKRWAEKSRVKNLRGWRVNAIKTPKYEYLDDVTVVSTQVILSNAVIYSDMTCTISPLDYISGMTDLRHLYKRLKKDLPLVELRYKHSLFGSGEVK
jgi:hypothetical protein